jgi:hypothetical protein
MSILKLQENKKGTDTQQGKLQGIDRWLLVQDHLVVGSGVTVRKLNIQVK